MEKKFNEWMASIGNIYYTDDDKMANAFKIIDNYEKCNKFFRTVSGKGVYSLLRPKLINASSNSLKLFKDKNTKSVCEIFYVVGIVFCSKCRDVNCTNKTFYNECINSKHLCENMKEMLKNC